MAHAVFHKCLHVTQFVATIMAHAFQVIRFHRFLLHQHFDAVSQLNFVAGARRRFRQQRPNIGGQHVTTDNRRLEGALSGDGFSTTLTIGALSPGCRSTPLQSATP